MVHLKVDRYGTPEGVQLRAGTAHLTVDIDGSFVLSSTCLPTNGHGRSSIGYGLWLTRTGIQPTSQQAGTCINDGIDADAD